MAAAVEPQSKCHQVSTPTEKETLCLRGFDPTSWLWCVIMFQNQSDWMKGFIQTLLWRHTNRPQSVRLVRSTKLDARLWFKAQSFHSCLDTWLQLPVIGSWSCDESFVGVVFPVCVSSVKLTTSPDFFFSNFWHFDASGSSSCVRGGRDDSND